MNSHLILIVSWLLYCILHSVLASEIVKVKMGRRLHLSESIYRILYNIFALLSLIALLVYHFSVVSPRLFQINFLTIFLAPFIIFIGLTGMAVCIVKYFRQLSGLQAGRAEKQRMLETGGIHRYVRHPLYISTFVFLSGLFLLSPLLSNLIAVITIIVYTIIGIRFEEKKLIKEFGAHYIAYKRKVPMLIPFFKQR